MMFSLKGKRALVSGGGRGIGKSIARGLLEQGADVTIIGRTESTLENACSELMAKYGGNMDWITCDISRPETIEAMFKKIADSSESLDILVNNAALHMSSPIEDMDLARAQHIINTNIMGLYVMSRCALPLLKKSRAGKVINLTSMMASLGRKGIGVYSATKAAISQITRILAIEWAEYGIQVNGIAPGMIATDFTTAVQEDAELAAYFKNRAPLHKIGSPDDCAACAVFLACDENTFMTGSIITIDGGLSIQA